MLLSIVVPVYNGEAYLEASLARLEASLVAEGDVEVILVDDGSTDATGPILDAFGARVPRAKVIHQENLRQGGARNTALRVSRSTFVAFLDADDACSPAELVRVARELDESDTELALCSWSVEHLDGVVTEHRPPVLLQGRVWSGPALFGACRKARFHVATVWPFVYRRAFLEAEGIRFLERRVHEDLHFVAMVLAKARRAIATEHPIYTYCARQGSTVSSDGEGVIARRVGDLLFVARDLEDAANTLRGTCSAATRTDATTLRTFAADALYEAFVVVARSNLDAKALLADAIERKRDAALLLRYARHPLMSAVGLAVRVAGPLGARVLGLASRVRTALGVQGEEGSRLVRSVFWVLATNFGRLPLSFATSVLVMRALGPTGQGQWSFGHALVGIGSALTWLIPGDALVREMARSPEEAPVLVGTAFVLRAFLGFLSGAALLAYEILSKDPAGGAGLALMLASLVVMESGLTFGQWFFARSEPASYQKGAFVSFVAYQAALASLALARAPIATFFVAFSGWHLLNLGIGAWQAHRQGLQLGALRFRWRPCVRLVRASFPLFLSLALAGLVPRLDRFLLKEMAGFRAVGDYAAGASFADLWISIPVMLLSVIAPRMLYTAESEALARNLRVFLRVGLPLAIVGACVVSSAGALLIPRLIGPAFEHAVPVFLVLAWGIVPSLVTNVSTHFLLARGETRYVLLRSLFALVFLCACSYLLVPRKGALGMALASVASAFGASLVLFLVHPGLRGVAGGLVRLPTSQSRRDPDGNH